MCVVKWTHLPFNTYRCLLLQSPYFPIVAVEVGTLAIPFPAWKEWITLLILLAVPGTGHLLMNWAHLHVTLSFAGVIMLSIPVISSLGAWLFLDERVTEIQIIGMVVVISTLFLVAKREAEISTTISCLLYTSPSPRDMRRSRMPSSA